MKHAFFLLALISTLAVSCTKETDGTPPPAPEISGCTDSRAINYNPSATKDNGTCRYSDVTFYGAYGSYAGVPIMNVAVSVAGNPLGNLGIIYPSGPGNCSAPGTLSYSFQNGQPVDWNGTITLANGAVLFSSGTVTPSGLNCIKVNVTR
jgi:hypothetical protein